MDSDVLLRGISLSYFQFLEGEEAHSPIEEALRGLSLSYFQFLNGPEAVSNINVRGISLKEAPYPTTGTPGSEGGAGSITNTYFKIIRK